MELLMQRVQGILDTCLAPVLQENQSKFLRTIVELQSWTETFHAFHFTIMSLSI